MRSLHDSELVPLRSAHARTLYEPALVALADIPERRDDLVNGSYELSVPANSTCVGVKITDMLGEEVLVALPLEA